MACPKPQPNVAALCAVCAALLLGCSEREEAKPAPPQPHVSDIRAISRLMFIDSGEATIASAMDVNGDSAVVLSNAQTQWMGCPSASNTRDSWSRASAAISEQQRTALASCLAQFDFWNMPDRINPNVMDGSQWLILATDMQGRTHAVYISNEMTGTVKELGLCIKKWTKTLCRSAHVEPVPAGHELARAISEAAWQQRNLQHPR